MEFTREKVINEINYENVLVWCSDKLEEVCCSVLGVPNCALKLSTKTKDGRIYLVHEKTGYTCEVYLDTDTIKYTKDMCTKELLIFAKFAKEAQDKFIPIFESVWQNQ